ncbi:DUF2753 family protein [Motilimonas sp. 1_MG-2023]|uniref:DUF2753 family protein n=1 Tax=Motilimonas sp. 1_MG-2023 TaxID=3062672 RepID=UPI0026E22D7C|nr:DUF2753 family protein [Motilimonas sp. 1_MG-2023]MDO6526307.1 DUF2753 family protein [Motilimonas sp. 1_MG-2023]
MAAFSLDLWQTLSAQGQHFLRQGDTRQAEIFYKLALSEAQKLIDDLSLSAEYEHSARLYMTACHNLVNTSKGQGDVDAEHYYLQLAHAQLQQFADNDALTELTRVTSLKMLDVTLVGLLEFHQQHQGQHWQVLSDALVDEHVAYMAKHQDKNLAPSCEQCEGCQHHPNNVTVH